MIGLNFNSLVKMIRKTFLSILCIVFLAFSNQVQEASWMYDLENAKSKAKESNKCILLSFSGSDWCSNCMRLDQDLFSHPEFLSYAEKNLVLLKADFPMKSKNKLSKPQRKHNNMLVRKFNSQERFPMVLILNKDALLIDTMPYPLDNVIDYVKELKRLTMNNEE